MGSLLPTHEQADALLRQLGFDEADRLDVLAAMPSPERQPTLWELLEHAYQRVRGEVGKIDAGYVSWPPFPPELVEHERYFWIFVYLAAVPDIRRWHVERGVPEDISWATLADLGRHVRLYRRRNGRLGLDTGFWIALHFRGALYALGRLQFNPYRLLTGPAGPAFWYDPEDTRPGPRSGDSVLGVHIPESGPMDPVSCNRSFAAAAEFFPRLFPEYASRIATCTSWLLDDQLLEYLPADSNIVRFQKRFKLVPGARDSDDSIFHFVFGKPVAAAGDIEPRTTLERAILKHLEDGRHWRMRTGWLELSAE